MRAREVRNASVGRRATQHSVTGKQTVGMALGIAADPAAGEVTPLRAGRSPQSIHAPQAGFLRGAGAATLLVFHSIHFAMHGIA